MNNNQIKRAEMIALQSIGNNPAAGNQWHETERKIQTVKPMNYKRMIIALIVILAILLATDFAIVKYGLAGAFLMTVRDEQEEPKFHSDGYPTVAALAVLSFLLSCLIGALALANYCGVL